uniref:Adenine-specific DNA-methyltransferase n=1 Tax=Candidatus Kentrum sp. DK TaxID=2126562 RepID=A0A450SEA2_9GAMM|nr:MAG: adenine-specific DNA-methyltransferase [Candidatus Kentron sp. DK]
MPTLDWYDKKSAVARSGEIPYRLLEHVPALSHGEPASPNMLIQGDNLEGLKALLPFFAGQVKCIYIDPPYNTRSAFEYYDDNLEHSAWLSLLWPRLELLRELLAEDGSIWVSIDDNEAHYLKVMMDEVFGRGNFVANIAWQKRYSRDNNAAIGDVHEHILVYSIDPEKFKDCRNRTDPDEKTRKHYSNPNNDPKGPWQSISFTGAEYRENMMYPITAPNGTVHHPPPGRHWAALETEYKKLEKSGRIYFGKDGKGVPRVIRYLSEIEGLVPWSWWPHSEVSHTGDAKKEVNAIFGSEVSFVTPKPERLIQRILHIATNPNDLILDSFLGSGTTAAVAHKMGRRWIGIEMGEHAVTHCAPRLQKVIDGEQGGISKAVDWQGGGGFRFYRLGPPVFDEAGHIRRDIRFPVLAAHVWFSETGIPWPGLGGGDGGTPSPVLGVHDGRGFALLYNGVLRDRRINGGNVLTHAILKHLREELARPDWVFTGPLVVYGVRSAISDDVLKREGVVFRQTPYEVKARR